jgi:ribonuclease-3
MKTNDLTTFEQEIGITFTDKQLLRQAFTHRSYINENPGVGTGHNERLEFLGDAVLELVITDYLYKKYPDTPEGELTAYRAALVNTNSISDAARELGMNEYLLLSKGEAKEHGKSRAYILANTFEACIGAVYLDQGYRHAEEFIAGALFGKIESIVKKGTWRDAKSAVQEKAQETVGVTPSYRVLREVGPDHDKVFTVGIYFGEEQIATGNGKSKQEAETDAARAALELKKWHN